MKGAKMLYLDIESYPEVAYVWGLRKQMYIPPSHVVQDGSTACFAAKWAHKKKPMFFSEWEHGQDGMIEAAWDLLNEADILIHYNGNGYDIPHLQREMLLQDMIPPAGYKNIDLMRVVMKHFRFPSYKLDYVLKRLGMPQKVPNKGMELWDGCMKGESSDHKIMRKYNINDVKIMEPLYERLRPWIDNHPHMALYGDLGDDQGDIIRCTNCGSADLVKNGREPLSTGWYQRYRCNDCGTNVRGTQRKGKVATRSSKLRG